VKALWVAAAVALCVTGYGYFTSPDLPASQEIALSAR